jgi:hypothetical protein
MLDQIAALVNDDAFLQRKGRYVSCVLMVEAGGARYRLTIKSGNIESVESTRLIMARYDLLMRASADTWNRFWEPMPAPGYNDLFALLKKRLLTIEGDVQPFMANLFYFKGVLEMPRRLVPGGNAGGKL